jgi:hypothetical protein
VTSRCEAAVSAVASTVDQNPPEENEMHAIVNEALASQITSERVTRARAERLLPRRRRRFLRRERRGALTPRVAAAR